jgi:hypothetical protein
LDEFQEEQMAANQPKANTYRTLYRVNRAFDFITEQLGQLGRAGMLDKKHTFQAFTQELQAEINHQASEDFQATEETDWARFGKIGYSRFSFSFQVLSNADKKSGMVFGCT